MVLVDFCAGQSGKAGRDQQRLHPQCHLSGCKCKHLLIIIALKLFKMLKCRILVGNFNIFLMALVFCKNTVSILLESVLWGF